MKESLLLLLGLVGILFSGTEIRAQQIQDGCLRLLGSVACPAYQYAYLNPANLSNAFPFFTNVNSVATFDAAALAYFSNPYQFTNTKFGNDQLGCSNASQATIRWERTVLCSMWVNEMYSLSCTALYNSSTAATSMKMVCQSTCLEYSSSEYSIVNSSSFCPGSDLTQGRRDTQLVKDFTDCTNWTTLATNNTESCISGESNEGNCGFGSSTNQLCDYCNNDNPDDCCYQGSTDVSVCGYTLPVRPNASSSSSLPNTATATSSPTGTTANDTAGRSSKITGGKLAGIIVGSVLGGLLLLALLIFLLICMKKRRKQHQRDSVSSFAASQARPNSTSQQGIFGYFTSNHGGGNGKQPMNTSEKGLIGRYSGNGSSPTMGGETAYSQSAHGHTKSTEGLIAPSAAAAGFGAGAAGAGMTAGNRNSTGTVLPRVKDENQLGERWIEPGMEVSVLWPYQASLPDELDLRPGMRLRVVRLFDDAWGTAEVISASTTTGEGSMLGKQGAFPIVCVSEGSSLGSSIGHSSSSNSH
ncbi:uncharacterized protein IL334_007938 [Kwoniella shivajii]|uniref:SH3 domain-containing protein n=1 Tax=Kwoniella shivajii TaxID=564305 RepID=A0ABZ1DCB6_9TREE|nr:hypothetical protein IL334_007938 [Kwoniella shivajii]